MSRMVACRSCGHWKSALACDACGAVPQEFLGGGLNVIADVPEHYNETLGMRVRSRRHLTSIQREHGYQDYEPSAEVKERLRYGREKMLRDARG